jgi:hypothetical protein
VKKPAGIVLAITLMALTAGVAWAASSTHAHIYEPFNSAGKPVGHVTHTYTGSCYSGSLSSPRKDAWRCISGNALLDPCFSSSKAKHFVLCPVTGPWSSKVVKLKLIKKLPKAQGGKANPSTHGMPWALVTVKGWKCQLDTGATRVVHHQRENYFCKGTKQWLYGSPERGSEPWKIYVAGPKANHLSKKTGIKAAWF